VIAKTGCMKTVIVVLISVFICSSTLCEDENERLFHFNDEEIEAIQLKKFPNIIRNDWVLEIKTSKSTVTLKDKRDQEQEAENVRYYFIGYIDVREGRTDYLIIARYYEGHRYFLINGLNGNQVSMYGIPILSPDSKHYVVTSLDIGAGYSSNYILILDSDDYKIEWEENLDEKYHGNGGPSDPVWLDENSILFFEPKHDGNYILEKKPYIIEKKDGKWQLPRLLK
jgi:hypothetical protein